MPSGLRLDLPGRCRNRLDTFTQTLSISLVRFSIRDAEPVMQDKAGIATTKPAAVVIIAS